MALTEAEIQAHIDLIDAAIDALVTRKVLQYRIGERMFRFYDLPALQKLRAHYEDMMTAIPAEEATIYDDPDI